MNTATLVIIIVGFSLLTTAITLFTVFLTLRNARGERQKKKDILANGISASAIIRSIEQTSSQLDDQPIVLLSLTVTRENGDTFDTVIKTAIPIISIPQFQPGRTIEVKYITEEGRLLVEAVGAYIP
ncbi:hypothetical protein N0M98_04305 [Paenibacillus doosanensis]|uniref:DUF3592 domain-containing protein n=1 Tax=Paenibacillus konkukensis TaxID=2020716 RepID=A0ABY4RXW0_9BACL|nr:MULTISPECIES: hypothetical protein [Paenibacillus]MCS7459353.1 hypothetical protein [Paenibacillus doosanensis]UQZ87147.1 hypothetical protein SK3146_06443 [Paenibacillus konkukensis]